MSIQANINQGLSLASLLIAQNPTVQAKAKQRELVSNLSARRQSFEKMRDVSAMKSGELAEKYQTSLAETSKELFEADPSEERLAQYLKDWSGTPEAAEKRAITTQADPEEVAQELFEKEQFKDEVNQYLQMYRQATKKADQSLQVRQEEKRASRRNFLDYLKDEPISFGKGAAGTIGELSPQLQKTIASSYSKKEKQKIMNRKDEANE